jgi:SAM-dependent methyltransferase
MNLTDETSPHVNTLRERMDAFYSSSNDYVAFQEPSCNTQEWAYVKDAIRQRLPARSPCRVLEFGAGRTGFAEDLGGLRNEVHLTVQDVTSSNEEYLRGQVDEVHIGGIEGLRGPFDVIFSTFVLEHISDPRRSLQALFDLLTPGGSLFLFCPRYDVPLYLSHSADHYGVARRLSMAAYVSWKRLVTLLTGEPAFIVHCDPALLHMEWRMDRDAIHWASLFDLRAFFRGRAKLRPLVVHSGSMKDWFVKNFLRINLQVIRPAS